MTDKTKEKAPAISVIIPAYNVEEYIDRCMRTVADQTFGDFEVILIDDGSTDRTGEKCTSWAESDPRITFVSQENKGVSASRNRGLDIAKGEYIAFVDPDDWLDPSYFEKLFSAAAVEDADFAECDIYRYDNITGDMIYRSCGSRMGVPFTKEEHMIYGPTALYKSISKRSLWNDNGIRFPDCSFESPAVYPLILALSEKTVSVTEALYYYRRRRPGSLVETGYGRDGKPDSGLGTDAAKALVEAFKERGLYEENMPVLERIIKYRMSDILAMQYHRQPKQDYDDMVLRMRDTAARLFPKGMNRKYAVWGGYNLNRILLHLPMVQDPSMRQNFASVASVLTDGPCCGENQKQRLTAALPDHRNKYRRLMLRKEWKQGLMDILEEEKPDVLFIDLLEERNDLISCVLGGERRVLTKSDAFDGAKLPDDFSYEVLARGGDECEGLMEKALASFIAQVKELLPEITIVIVENYLSEKVGNISACEEFEDIDNIRKTNTLLKGYYNILRECCPDAVFVRTDDIEPRLTDEKYEYGAIPSHLNEIANEKIARRIECLLKK